MQIHVVSAVRCASVALALLVGASGLQAQQGSILVQITEQGSGRPVEAAQVAIVGTNIGGITNSEGRLLVRNVPAGTAQVRALRVGYGGAAQAGSGHARDSRRPSSLRWHRSR